MHFVTVQFSGRSKSYFYDEDTRVVTGAKADVALDRGDHVVWPEGIEHWILRETLLDGRGNPVIHADGRIRTKIVKHIKDNIENEFSEELLDAVWEDSKNRGQGKGRS